MFRKKLKYLLPLAAVCSLAASGAQITPGSFGMQSHFEHPVDDFPYLTEELNAMKKIGVKFLRTDLHWKKREFAPGKWDFKQTDKVVEAANKAGFEILMTIAGSTNSIPKFYLPIMKNLDALDRYTRTIVKRYKGKVKYWQVGNEQDSGSPAVSVRELNRRPDLYIEFLKVCSKAIRETDPDAVVLAGGLTSPGAFIAPYEYMEGMLSRGLAKYCDVLCIHPYPLDLDAEEAYPGPMRQIRKLMKKYNAEKMQLWADEVGETCGPMTGWTRFFKAAFKTAGIDPTRKELAVVADHEWHFFSENRYTHRGIFEPRFGSVREITLKEIAKLDPAKHVLLWNAQHNAPPQFIPAAVDFVRKGGVLIFPKGFPLYTETIRRKDGMLIGRQVNAKYMPDFHVAWDSFWTAKGKVPGSLNKITGPGGEGCSDIGRVISTRNLKGNDKFIPLVVAHDTKPALPLGGVFKLNSDLKGTIIMHTGYGRSSRCVSVDIAGNEMPRQFLLLRAYGVDKIFIYKMRQYPHQTSFTYGVFNPELRPLPAALGLETVMKSFPDGTKLTVVREGKPWIVKGVRPDGKTVWAIWNPRTERVCNLAITGRIETVYGNFMERYRIDPAAFVARPALTYIVGPKNITVK